MIKAVMAGHEVEVWLSDCYSAQVKSMAKERQLCLAHQLRNMQAAVDDHPASFWPKAMQALFRSAIHVYNQGDHLSPPEFQSRVQCIEQLRDWVLERTPDYPDAKGSKNAITRPGLPVRLPDPTDVCPTNNVSEHHLRP